MTSSELRQASLVEAKTLVWAWLVLVVIGMIWLYAHHFFAGIRYLLLDVHVGIMKQPARSSAVAVLVLGVIATLVIAWRIW